MPKDEVVVLRVTSAEKARLTAKAVSEGRTLGGWARWVLEREAGGQEGEAYIATAPEIDVKLAGGGLRRLTDIVGAPDVKPKAAVKLKPGVEEAIKRGRAPARRPGERCPHCNQKKCKGECW